MFKKILIANRGEIACRIARTCARMGLPAATVHSAADRGALHVRTVGESVEIGPAPAAESYLSIPAIVGAARATGCDAVHPGFGFLSENAAFARALAEAGLAFIGPSPAVLEGFGDKAAAKRAAVAAGIPVVPGGEGASADPAAVRRIASAIPLPVLLKASAGGGGKGMRVVRDAADLDDEIAAAMREAKSSFGDPSLIVERFVENARHIEVQILGDGRGEVIHLFERECSLQRRHQKVVEEAPAAGLPATVRARLLDDAVRLGHSVSYLGLGTVEFIVEPDGTYYFLEVNPRLQVEHPVTEAVTGLDLIELQIRAVAGEGLPLRQSEVTVTGHAVEARVYAEDAAAGFLPSTGTLGLVSFPEGVRVDSGVESGDAITPHYDPMVAKLIAQGPDRSAALAGLARALDRSAVQGVTTNIPFLRALLAEPRVLANDVHTRFIDGWTAASEKTKRETAADPLPWAAAGLIWLRMRRDGGGESAWGGWTPLLGWRLGTGTAAVAQAPSIRLVSGRLSRDIAFGPYDDGTVLVAVDGETVGLALSPLPGGRWLVEAGPRSAVVAVSLTADRMAIDGPFGSVEFRVEPFLTHAGAGGTAKAGDGLRAPMMGKIVRVAVAEGDRVSAGDVVLIIESMKMEYRVTAPHDGLVAALACREGDTVERDAVVASIAADPDAEAA